jgi:CheY-like chemotaxis protein/MinD-like ATPase involved in chromosome partitioning or flagellar assembly
MAEKILIVDDDNDTLRLLTLMLKRQNYTVVAAVNGTEALQQAVTERPDLVLLDVMMPDMDGYEVTAKMRANPALRTIPILMFTAKTMVDDRVAGFEAGVDDYMTKPAHPAELLARVRSLLARRVSQVNQPNQGHLVGFLGTRHGLGLTTLALNVATAMSRRGMESLLCEFRPGHGTLGYQLGLLRRNGLANLLCRSVAEINLREVEAQLVTHSSGLRLLLASDRPGDLPLADLTEPADVLLRQLRSLSKWVLLDAGGSLTNTTAKLLGRCDLICLVIDSDRITLQKARVILDALANSPAANVRIEVICLNRNRNAGEVLPALAHELLNRPVQLFVSPAAEQLAQAQDAETALVDLIPADPVARQYMEIARKIVKTVHPQEALSLPNKV